VWSYRVVAPGRVEQVGSPAPVGPLPDGQVLVRVLVAGLCGSDMPRLGGSWGRSLEGDFGPAPVHEIVGEVVASASPGLAPSQRVVGTLGPSAGLAELVRVAATSVIAVPDDFDDLQALAVQPVATVLRAMGQVPDVKGRRVAVLGAGPCGLAFCHVLNERGAAHISAVDPVERSGTAKSYGADTFACTTSTSWSHHLDGGSRPDIVIEAVGHQHRTIVDALHAVADGGFVFGFGEVDDDDYVLPYREMYLRDLALASGRTIDDWPAVLRAGAGYLRTHREAFRSYISHVLPISQAQQGYSLYARPQWGRLKVVLVTEA
jgi:L-iditol 2-dehydrogenase